MVIPLITTRVLSKLNDKIIVGTDIIYVSANITTVGELKKNLQPSHNATQTWHILDVNNQSLSNTASMTRGIKLQVTAIDGTSQMYQLTTVESAPPDNYWDTTTYNVIDSTVNASMPAFPAQHVAVTDSQYLSLIMQLDEHVAINNKAGDPAQKDSPLKFDTHTIWYYGNAINQAIADIHEAGGGFVYLPADGARNANGVYYSGAIRLLSGVNLVVESGAEIRFMLDPINTYYPIVLTSYEGNDLYNFSPCIYALGQHDIAVTGGGLLNGQEDMWNWRPWKKGYWGEPWVDNRDVNSSYGENGILNRQNFTDVPVSQRVYTATGEVPATVYGLAATGVAKDLPNVATHVMRSSFRPNFVEFNHCYNVLMDGVQIRHTPFWAIHPLNSKNILIQHVNLYSNRTKDFESSGWNNDDGIDPESCQNVVLAHNDVTVSDDGVAIKAGRNHDGRLRRKPTTGVIIRNSYYCNAGGESAAISIGSEMSAGVSDVFVHNCCFGGRGLSQLLKLKTNAIRGGYIHHIYVRDCQVNAINRGLIQIDSNYPETVPFPHTDLSFPQIDHIYLQNIITSTGLQAKIGFIDLVSAMPSSPPRDLYLRNIIYHTDDLKRELHLFDNAPFLANLHLDHVQILDDTINCIRTLTTVPIILVGSAKLTIKDGAFQTIIPMKTVELVYNPSAQLTLSGQFCGIVKNFHNATLTIDQRTRLTLILSADGKFVSPPFTLSNEKRKHRNNYSLVLNVQGGISNQTIIFSIIA